MSTTAATILVVDDEIQNRKLLETLLRPEGYLTVTATTGGEALAAVAQHAPDLILLDVMMPGMDGYQVARTLKAGAGTSSIPIIMVTALADRSARMAGLEAGVEEFLTKPIDRAELWLRVRNLLRLKAFGDLVQNNAALLEQQVEARTAELRQSEARFSAFMESSPVLAWVKDCDGNLLYTNKAWHSVFEIDPVDGRPRPKGGACSDELLEPGLARDMESSASAQAFQSHLRISEPGGALRYLNIVKFPIQEASGRTVWGRIAVDVTRQKLAETEILDLNAHLEQRVAERTVELEQARNEANIANQAKSSFLATMSHEIRTPMNGIVGMVDVLAHGRLSEHQGEAVRVIRESAFALLQLLEDLLDFSKIEAGRLDMERMPVSIADLAEAVCEALTPVADSKDVDVFLRISPAGPAKVWSDPVRLRQILYNLLGNAIKFSGGRAKRGRVELRVEVASEAPLRVRFQVIDDGIGMSQDTQLHLFESFRQAEPSTTRRFGGSGLGLAICKRLVELMGGHIVVESTQWLGSSFTVELPLDPVEGSTSASLADLCGLDFVLVPGPCLDVENVRACLERAGGSTHVVGSGADAVALCAEMPSPVVVHAAIDDADRDTWLGLFARLPKVRHLLLSRGRRRVARVTGPNVVVIDGNSMRRRSLLHAAAVAAGRASPETGYQTDISSLTDTAITVPTVPEARMQGRLILIAEDDSSNQKVLLRQLALLGYAAEVANDGLEALHLWRGGGHALLLTDLHMPGLDGYGLTSAIRHEEGGRRHIPILALTANAMHGEASRALSAGLDEYLTKPMQLSVLREVMDKWLPLERAPTRGEQLPVAARGDGPRPVLDIAVLRNIVGDAPDTLREVLVDYEQSARTALVALDAALAVDDLAAVGKIAHRLTSASRTVGALPVGDLCSKLENACRLADRTGVAQTMAHFTPAFVELLESVNRRKGMDL